MSKILVSMWVYEEDRDLLKVKAAKSKKTMPDEFHEALQRKGTRLAAKAKATAKAKGESLTTQGERN